MPAGSETPEIAGIAGVWLITKSVGQLVDVRRAGSGIGVAKFPWICLTRDTAAVFAALLSVRLRSFADHHRDTPFPLAANAREVL